jgi:hypothetical protein
MVFVGNGGAKQGHNAIAEHLIHRALEAVHGGHHALQGRVEKLLGGFGIKAADEFCGVLEVGKQHRHLLALAGQGGAGSEDFVGEMGWGVDQRWCVWLTPLIHCGCGDWLGRDRPSAGPDQDLVVLIHGNALRLNNLVLQVLQAGIVEPKLPLKRVIGHAPPLAQQVQHLIQHVIKVHG